ncbi:thermonuclease family protein [Calditerrivibrio sp.]|jgi:endonuclease YncB( thermonuclease family)|uniref:Nuclease n=1 Tax=Calditerrivibrio nitroreducens TaxID=477976 RepID=A0A2J6WG60_9BACT|nr:MAG: nuclease [Calditerrivibrio nitroreducens]
MSRFLKRSFLAVFIVLIFISLSFAEIIKGKVVGVSDGDTITLLAEDNKPLKIRLAQIDAPEKKQDFGQKSKQSLSDLIYLKDVTVKVWDVDRYGRIVGQIFYNNLDVNLEQVKRGMAWVYFRYAKDPEYFKAMEIAKSKKIGLWSMPNPIPPWEFRKLNRNGNN